MEITVQPAGMNILDDEMIGEDNKPEKLKVIQILDHSGLTVAIPLDAAAQEFLLSRLDPAKASGIAMPTPSEIVTGKPDA